MKHVILATCGALAVAGALTVSAQTPTSTPRPPSPTPAPSTPTMSNSADDKPITVSGCLKTWDNSMGTAPAGSGATTYVLTNVESDDTMAKGKPESTAAKPESTTATRPTTAASQYIVTAASSVNLAAHLNHKVRVSGTTSKMTDPSGAGTTPPSAEPQKPGDPARPATDRAGDKGPAKLNVTSLTMVSATCPAQSQ